MQLPPDEDPNSELSPKALARTYDTPGQVSPWDAVEQYRRVQRVASRNPTKGSTALSTRLDLPRGRIRPWLDGGAPDVVRGLARAHAHGWFASNTVVAWAPLVAGILGGGSITTGTYQPEWTTNPEHAARRIEQALAELDVGHTRIEREDYPDYIRPGVDQSVLGRALAALGAPVGDKNVDSDPLPDWLLSAPLQARLEAVEVLVLYRGQAYSNKDTVSLFETRSGAFRESVATLIESVVDGTVTSGNRYVQISAEAARELGVGRDGVLRDALEE